MDFVPGQLGDKHIPHITVGVAILADLEETGRPSRCVHRAPCQHAVYHVGNNATARRQLKAVATQPLATGHAGPGTIGRMSGRAIGTGTCPRHPGALGLNTARESRECPSLWSSQRQASSELRKTLDHTLKRNSTTSPSAIT